MLRRAHKRAAEVAVQFAHADGRLQTLEGEIAVQAGDAIVTGPQGERWAMPPAEFARRYEPVPAQDGLYRRLPLPVHAARMAVPFSVPQATGTLHGGVGDWLVLHADGALSVVAADRFDTLYRL